jgi:hypothetical protein
MLIMKSKIHTSDKGYIYLNKITEGSMKLFLKPKEGVKQKYWNQGFEQS